MKTTDGRDIKYLQQIINQYAYIESLITDNVKPQYTLSASTATGAIERFTYKHPRYDLVQVKIYEVRKDGTTKHYGTLYVDEDYNEGSKTYKVNDYAGVFAKYYSESLNAIAGQIGQDTDVFNTNKNWKVEFIYDEVERVYIKFKDLKGNSIFIQDPKNPGRYIGEITEKIPQSGYSYTPTDLGANGKFVLVQYTEDRNGYVDDLTKSKEISSGTTVSVPPNDGDRYIIFYYLTGKMLTVEYRDINENNIKENLVTEISTTGAVVEIPDIDLYQVVGYKHNPDYDGIGHIIGTNTAGENIYGINAELRELTTDDNEISVPNPNETSHHVIIYYKSKEGLKVEYRDINGDTPIAVPPQYVTTETIEIPGTGTKVEVPTVPGYKAHGYLKNDNYNGTDTTIPGTPATVTEGVNIPVHPNGNNQFIIIYYEKIPYPAKVIVEFKEGTPDGPDIKDPVEMDIPTDVETPIYVPDIEGYTPEYYEKDDNPTDLPIPEDATIEVIGDPDNPIKIVIVYIKREDPIEPTEPDIPIIITPDDNIERVYLNANIKGSEEYKTEEAIPTSEDLYVSGDVYSYRFVTEMEKKDFTETVKVEIHQPYYTDLDHPERQNSISVKLNVDLTYKYFEILKAELYDLKALQLENGAIKYYNNYNYDTGSFGEYVEGKANFPVTKKIPTLEYNLPTGIATGDDSARIQINSTDAYRVDYIPSSNTYKITIKDVDYYEAVNKAALENQLKSEAMAILEKCTKIKVQTLKINMEGAPSVEILTGEKYDLPNKSEALESTDYYIPYVAGRTPLYSFFHDKDLYVREEAENRMYISQMEGDYRLIESIPAGSSTITTHNPIGGIKLKVEKINANPLNIHTPIINLVTFIRKTINEQSVQLDTTVTVPIGSEDNREAMRLNLEERFTIEIKNNGNHITNHGYGNNKAYNHKGLTANGDETNDTYPGTPSRIQPKSNDVFMTPGIIKNIPGGAVVDKTKVDTIDQATMERSDKNAIGPSFAEYKLIRFPYDVYLVGTVDNAGNVTKTSLLEEKPHLLKANEWYNLNEFVKPNQTKFEFAIPTWVQDATAYMDGNGIHVLIVAENCSLERLEEAMANPLSVKTVDSNVQGKNNTYILRSSFNTYISGRLYDLEIRDTDDVGFMGKIKPALTGKPGVEERIELPLAQQGQLPAYKMGLKLGYRFYFDLKTKGIANKNILITPKIYYVSLDGTRVTDDISLFYHTKGTLYNKLPTSNLITTGDLNVKMTMSTTHGNINNAGYVAETISAKQLDPTRIFTNQVIIGKLVNGIKLVRETQKLPYDNIAEVAEICGFETNTAGFIESAVKSESIDDDIAVKGPNDIKNATGRWYGEYYLPASTIVAGGTGTTRDQMIKNAVKPITTGYLVVVFEEITTEDDVKDETEEPGYLTYDAHATNSQWSKEGLETTIILPNGKKAEIPTSNASEAAPMAIYQVGLRANNDFETEGTH